MCLFGFFFLYAERKRERERESPGISSYKETNHIGLGFHPYLTLIIIHNSLCYYGLLFIYSQLIPKGPIPITVTLGVRAST